MFMPAAKGSPRTPLGPMYDIKGLTIPEPNKEIKAAINSTFID